MLQPYSKKTRCVYSTSCLLAPKIDHSNDGRHNGDRRPDKARQAAAIKVPFSLSIVSETDRASPEEAQRESQRLENAIYGQERLRAFLSCCPKTDSQVLVSIRFLAVLA